MIYCARGCSSMAHIEKPILGGQGEHRWQRSDVQKLLTRIGRYTRFVSFSKLLLGGMSIVMIATIVVMPLIHGDKEGIRLAFSSVQEQAESVPMMTNPTFQGVDEKNQPYYVTADSALQLDSQQIVLNKVQGDMLTDVDAWLSVKADKGLINNEKKTMRLSESVELLHFDGYEFETDSVEIDMQARSARGSSAVKGYAPVGEISADGFDWDHNAKVLRFNGNVKVRLVDKNG